MCNISELKFECTEYLVNNVDTDDLVLLQQSIGNYSAEYASIHFWLFIWVYMSYYYCDSSFFQNDNINVSCVCRDVT